MATTKASGSGSVNGTALRQILGDVVVVSYNAGYHVNPDGSGAKELPPGQEQMVIDHLAFPETGGRVPLPDDKLKLSGIVFCYEGF